jgi:hypothetical protein
MGSIPHGTTINAQGAAPSGPSSGGPQFSAVSLQPFLINGGAVPAFPQLKVENENAPRLPSDLTLFNSQYLLETGAFEPDSGKVDYR